MLGTDRKSNPVGDVARWSSKLLSRYDLMALMKRRYKHYCPIVTSNERSDNALKLNKFFGSFPALLND